VVRGIRWILAVGAAVLLLAGCGDDGGAETAETRPERQEKTERPEHPRKKLKLVEVTLDGAPSAENVGILLAKERGYFEDAGLDVSIHIPVIPKRPVTYVSERAVDLGVTHEPQIAIAKEKGAPIVALRSLIRQPTAAMIWLGRSKIGGLSDLKGKTIAIPGVPFQIDLLEKVLAGAGLGLSDVKVKEVEYLLVPALLSGRADAIFGGSWNVEGIELDARGMEPVITRVEDLDVPAYKELVLITRRDRLAKDPKSIRAFLAALARGTAAAIEDPEAATEMLVKETLEPDRQAIEAQVDATLPLLAKTGLGQSGR
jgi:ABC-type nitrate/sulfonate/bicarbonate transport system substrate-binding protein